MIGERTRVIVTFYKRIICRQNPYVIVRVHTKILETQLPLFGFLKSTKIHIANMYIVCVRDKRFFFRRKSDIYIVAFQSPIY